jgi:hypothetical protein
MINTEDSRDLPKVDKSPYSKIFLLDIGAVNRKPTSDMEKRVEPVDRPEPT